MYFILYSIIFPQDFHFGGQPRLEKFCNYAKYDKSRKPFASTSANMQMCISSRLQSDHTKLQHLLQRSFTKAERKGCNPSARSPLLCYHGPVLGLRARFCLEEQQGGALELVFSLPVERWHRVGVPALHRVVSESESS